MARVVVIGAGLGGLAAAARLCAAGHAVTVCEATADAGGKLARHEHRTAAGTFRFDVGPTLLTLPDVFTRLFAETGDPLEAVLSLQRLDPIVRYRFADGAQVDTTSDLERQRAQFDDALGAGTGAAWQRLLDRGAAIWRAVEEPVFGAALSGSTVYALAKRLGRLSDLRAVAPGRTLRGLARSTFQDPRQQRMLERYATYSGSDPRRAPAVLNVIAYLEQAFGGWYVEGGLYGLAEALTARIDERGGTVRLGTPVTGVERAGNRVTGVRLGDGSRLPADVVVCNADARVLYGELQPGTRRVPVADSFSGFVLLLGLRGRAPGLAQHTVLFGDAPYDQEFDALFGRSARPVDDPTIYLHAPEDPACAPPDHEALYVLVNAPRHGTAGAGCIDWTDQDLVARYTDRVLDLMARRGVDVRDRIVFRHTRTPADLARDTLAPGGSIYGRVQHGALATVRRPANRSRTRGLYLVGGSTHPGGGLPLVALSAQVVAAEIGGA